MAMVHDAFASTAPRLTRVDQGHHVAGKAHIEAEVEARDEPAPEAKPDSRIEQEPTVEPRESFAERESRWEANNPIVPIPDPVDGAIDSRIVMQGEDFTIRHWSPEAWARVPVEDRRPSAWEAATPGWMIQTYRHGDNPECKRRVEEFTAKLRAKEEARRNPPPVPSTPEDLEEARELARSILVRAVRRWEECRTVLAEIEGRPKRSERRGTIAYEAWSKAHEEAVFDCRQVEQLLGERIKDLSGVEDNDDYQANRLRPLGVRLGGVLYAITYDAVEAMNHNDPDHNDPIIIARIELDRVTGLDAIGGGL